MTGNTDRLAHSPARGGDELREALEQIAGLPHGLDIGYAGDIARAALASTDMAGAGEGLDRATLKHCARTIRDRAVTISAAPLGGGRVSEASKIAARHLISAAEAIEKDMAAAPPVEGLTSGEVKDLAERIRAAVTYQYMPMTVRNLLSEAAKALAAFPKATATASVRDSEAYEQLRHKLWMIACHATGGGIPEIEGIDRSVNDISVQITASRNLVYQAGKEAGRKEALATLTDSGTADTHAGTTNAQATGGEDRG